MITDMKKNITGIVVLLSCCFFLTQCNEKAPDAATDKSFKGRINISVDETFKPVIAEQIKVFEASYPEASIIANYKSEADCFRDLQKDSTTMILVARGLNDAETKFFQNKLSFIPRYDVLAYDAVAVIVNKSSNDSVFTMKQLSSYLRGEGTDKQVVLDGRNATSTVRYLLDSIVRGPNFGKNVTAAENSEGVVKFVSENPNAIGMVGISWVGDEQNPVQQAYLKKIRLAFVECAPCANGAFYQPTQQSVAEGRYPMYRSLYFILKENAGGLGSDFMGFMRYQRGQLIFKRARLVPGRMNLEKRTTEISESE